MPSFLCTLALAAVAFDISTTCHAGTVALPDKTVFPPDNAWNIDISRRPVDPYSSTYIATIGTSVTLHPDFGSIYGIPYNVVNSSTAKVPVTFDYASESDKGPYPIPANPLIESGSDHHLLVIDATTWILYELWEATLLPDGKWHAGSGAIWNLNHNWTRPAGWTSADAAGLPIFPGLVRYDEVHINKVVTHAFRFTVPYTREAYVAPASHWASSSTSLNLMPMGTRLRLKASFDISQFPADDQVILTALKKYGMILADNGSAWYITGAPDSRWNDDLLHDLTQVTGADFEVIKLGTVVHP
jgi:hypothetical protein